MMAVYLIHFERPISPKHSCQHYIGYADSVKARVEHHRKGTSKVRLFEVAKERGISFEVVKVWEEGDKKFERSLKKRKNAGFLCPICKGEKSRVRQLRRAATGRNGSGDNTGT